MNYQQPYYGGAQQQLPPMDRLIYQPIQLTPGYAPPVQVNVVVPGPLQQLYPEILLKAIQAIQAEAGNNQLRALLFNRLAANGYNNADFAQHMTYLMQCIELMIMAQPQVPPSQQIDTAAGIYTQFKVCNQIQEFPQLQQMIDPQLLQACQVGIQNFLGVMQQYEQQASNNARVYAQPQGYGQVQINSGVNQMASRFGMATGQVQGGWSPQGYSNPVMQAAMGQGQRPQAGWTPNPSRWNAGAAPTPAPAPAVPTGNWRNQAAATPSAPMPWNTPAPEKNYPAPRVETIKESTDKPFSIAGSTATTNEVHQPAPASPSAPPAVQNQDEPQKPWEPVNQQVAYDPNMFDGVKTTTETGVIKTTLREKPKMDREKHLGLPNRAPRWVKAPTLAEFENRMAKAEEAEPAGPVIGVVNLNQDGVQAFVLSEDEAWSRTRLSLNTQRKEQGKVVMTELEAMVAKPLPASATILDLIRSLIVGKDLSKAAQRVKQALVVLSDDEQLAVAEINKRLTDRVNRCISNEMALPTGRMDSFCDDMDDLLQYVKERYGEAYVEVLQKHTRTILTTALYHLDPEQETYKEVKQAYFGDDLPEDENDHPVLLIFADQVLFSCVDLNSAELRLELPQDQKYSVALMESVAPFAYQVINTLMSSKRRENSDRVLLATTDGVVLQLDQGAFDETAIMVAQLA